MPAALLAGIVTLSGNEDMLSAADATQLATLPHFTKGDFSITVSDTAGDLAFAGYAAGLALADHVQLSAASNLTVGAAETLIAMANFQVNDDAPLTIAGSLPHLLALATANLAHNNSILDHTAIALTANAVATVGQMQELAALPQFDLFSLNGYTITVEDSGRNLASFTANAAAMPSAYAMAGDATLDAMQAGVLAADNVSIGDNTLTVADTPACPALAERRRERARDRPGTIG